ncbi:MAG: glycosyltransferase family 4 protein [Planctomycetes bacterium]|nr:glycosyltransferase family 4 protein [Planctomycetota bacterium]
MKPIAFLFPPHSETYFGLNVFGRQLLQALQGLAGAPEILSWPPDDLRRKVEPWRFWADRFARPVFPRGCGVYHILAQGSADVMRYVPARRTIVTCHDLSQLRMKRPRLREARRWVNYGFFRYATGFMRRARVVVADSEAARRDAVELAGVPRGRVRVIPLGVDDEFFGTRPARGSKTRRLLHVGGCGPNKNIDGLLRILDRVRRRLPDVELVKAGAPLTPEQQRSARDLGVADRIRHVGRVERRELPGIFRDADLLIYPSLHEGFCLPVAEAMASGLPVIASKAGSIPEVAGSAAVLLPADEEDRWSEEVVRILSDDAVARRLSEEGGRRAQMFRWRNTAEAYLRVYREVAEA